MASPSMTSQRTPSRDELLARVTTLAPTLRDSAADSERGRTLCEPAVTALHDAGLFGLWSPPAVGGFDADFTTQVDVMIEVARADMSACWTMMIGASITAMMATGLPDEGLAEVFNGTRLPTGAGSLRPAGKAEPADGGFRVTGRWGFGSGIRHASWITANCLITENGKPTDPPQQMGLVVPIADVDVADDWYVAGLAGSGSNTYSVRDVFVPHRRCLTGGPSRGSVQNANMLPRIPLEHASVSLGGARHALDAVTAQAASKHRLLDPSTVAGKQAFQVELGRLEAQWTSLRAGVREVADELYRAIGDDTDDVPALTIKLRAVCAFATEQSLAIGGRALRHAGAGAVLDSNVLQRIHRDLTVSAQHVMISDAAYEDYAGSLLA